MSTPPDFPHSEAYQLGMVNPPRRVKRLRELALKDAASSSSSVTPLLSTSPSPRAPSPPAASNAPAPRRRGRKPAGPLSKSAREQLRKTNHSVIEKRRREKINEALAALRELVPNDKQDGERKEDKEFKLEVLVRTVEYLRVMVDKVKNLESAVCQKCGGSLLLGSQASSLEDTQLHRPVKRMRVEEVPDSDSEDIDNDNDHDAVLLHILPPPPYHHHHQHKPSLPPSKRTSPHPRLPSISSWMTDSSLSTIPPRDISLPAPNSNPKPTSTPLPLPNSHAYQLPSPPQTVPFAPTTIAATGFPPRLVLPSPVGPPIIGPASLASPAPLASSLASPAPFASSLVASPASLVSLKSPAPLTCPTLTTTTPTFTSLTSPAYTPTPAPLTTSRDHDRDRDVPHLPLDSDIDTEHSHPHMLRSPPSSGYGRYKGGGGQYSRGGGAGGGGDESGNSSRRNGSSQHGSSGTRHTAGTGSSGGGNQHSSWSRDDQTAASLLLNISSRGTCVGGAGVGLGEDQGRGLGQGQRETRGLGPGQRQHRTLRLKDKMGGGGGGTTSDTAITTNANTSSALPHISTSTRTYPDTRPDKGPRMRRVGGILEAQTPSSLLGMVEDSGGER